MSNQKQLVFAAIMYAEENNGYWVPNQPGLTSSWCNLVMDFDPKNPDNTNAAALRDPNRCVLAPYLNRNSQVFHCPTDKTAVSGEGERVRSVSMNGSVGTSPVGLCDATNPCPVNGQWLTGTNIGTKIQNLWRTYAKTSDMSVPGAAALWTFCDVNPNSIHDATFAVQCSLTGTNATIIDYPGSFHNGVGMFAFADGHAEAHKWTNNSMEPKLKNKREYIGGRTHPVSADMLPNVTWLQQHTSAKF